MQIKSKKVKDTERLNDISKKRMEKLFKALIEVYWA